jgi:hypothetical protein
LDQKIIAYLTKQLLLLAPNGFPCEILLYLLLLICTWLADHWNKASILLIRVSSYANDAVPGNKGPGMSEKDKKIVWANYLQNENFASGIPYTLLQRFFYSV